MILDQLVQCARYVALHPGFEAAFRAVQDPELATRAAGKYAIDGERLFAIVDRPNGRTREGARLEGHRKFIDIQVTLSGAEVIGWLPTAACQTVDSPYDPVRDLAFWKDQPETWLSVPPQHFCIFFPEDAHAPLAGTGALHKIVMKVAVDW